MTALETILTGRAWKIGDSVDTNQLAGGGLEGATRDETLRLNCLRGVRPDFPDGVREGDIVVAGQNFGCGSARQSAVEALQLSGVAAVLAESVARIHRRNSIALALPTYAITGIQDFVDDGDRIQIDYPARVVRNLSQQTELPLPQMPASVADVYRVGGVLELIRERLAEAGIVPPDGADSTPVSGSAR
ncbi:3-isopropylmalate dehydratase [Microbacterium sp. SYP-A9085]|uniref:LeuD/DmdB family oxidoreductase small subunit n=1 Tax=Microbacterium sp. SYP-A9085 TaxID=2664454 RepID=UPI0015620E55|nr:3-isopropylmalate dehydratase [Microbacterium sp. SYP-A9085]